MSINTNPASILSEEQKNMLFYIYEGEKVARDVYITLGKIHKDEETFALMQFSEQRHIDCTRDLCDMYGVETSQKSEEVVGEYKSLVLQTLYDACTEKGKRSLHDALEVGQLIENTEIEDLEQASIGMPSDVVDVYENIRKRNLWHLGAFEAALAREA